MDESATDVVAHDVHAEKGHKDEAVRGDSDELADAVGVGEVEAVEEKKLAEEEGAYQRHQVL